MTPKSIASQVFFDLLMPAVVFLNIYLYFYPLLYSCAFPRPSNSTPAPFRLLTLADPQLEGNTKLNKYRRPAEHTPEHLASLSPLERAKIELSFAGTTVRKYGKMLDLWGNDLYLKHVYRTMRRHTYPTHITVLGDMLGSQWIDDAEFWTRVGRFWRIFAGAEKVREGGVAEGREWRDRLVMMPGNHDVGYAGDISRKRLQRYEDAFGAFNYQLSFRGNGSGEAGEAEIPALRIAVLNSLTLDKPVWDEELARDSWEFVETLGEEKRQTLLLTHVPLWKPAGVCVDAPEVTYFLPENGGGIRSQNLLSKETSVELLEKVFGGHNGVVLTGHDHEGCGSFHSWDGEGEEWGVRRGDGEGGDGVREVTVRSMMGEYGGNVGLLSAWWDKDLKEWKFGYADCSLGIQHLWWTVHVVNVIAMAWGVILGMWHLTSLSASLGVSTEKKKKDQ